VIKLHKKSHDIDQIIKKN